jgi:hypothetical protein
MARITLSWLAGGGAEAFLGSAPHRWERSVAQADFLLHRLHLGGEALESDDQGGVGQGHAALEGHATEVGVGLHLNDHGVGRAVADEVLVGVPIAPGKAALLGPLRQLHIEVPEVDLAGPQV